ncbi:MAG: hypothetical protein M1812_004558 [Candelaria pacifica]|nr:MAG: hypothetical protein M1812_004558 [Candelaria pacifica]
MSYVRNLLLLGAISSLATRLVVAEPSVNDGGEGKVIGDNVPFQELLNSVPQDDLHAALHESFPQKYKHGVFQEDRTALEALHRDNAEIATKVIVLAKRQTNSTARPSSSSRASSTPANNPSTTTPAGQSSTVSQAPSSNIQTGSLTAGGVLTTTDGSGNTGVSTLSAGSVITSTDSAGNVVTVTVQPDAASSTSAPQSSSSITSTILQTTTLPNNVRSTITAITVVGPSGGSQTPSGTAGAPPTSSTATGTSGLQAGSAASNMGSKVLAIVGGALVIALAMQY